MIYFYNKFWLLFLPLSVLPLVLHLLFVKKSKKVEFTYLFLVQKIVNQYLPKKRIVDIIVVLLRCLIVFFIIIFLSYPVMYTSHKKNIINLFILIDNSFSMQQKMFNYTKFDLCKEYVIKLLTQLDNVNNLRIKVFLFNENVEVLNQQFTSINKNLFERISQLKPSFRNTNLSTAIDYVLTEFVEKQNDKSSLYKILVFTDLAEHVVQNNTLVTSHTITSFNNVDISFLYPKIEQNNFYFNNVSLSQENDFVEIKYVLESSPAEKKELVSELMFSGQPTGVKKVYTFDQTTKFKFVVNEDNKDLYGYLMVNTSDGLSSDNKFYFTYKKGIQKNKVLCIINEPSYLKGFNSKKFYFKNLSFHGTNFEIIPYEQEKMLEINNYNNYNVYIAVGLPNLDLLNNVAQDKTIIIFPAETSDIDNYSLVLDGVEFIELKEDENKFLLGEDEDFNRFIERFEYKNIIVKKRFLITITDKNKWNVLLYYSDGTPAVVNKNNTYLFSFSPDKNWSNFVYKPIFVGLLKYIINKIQKTEPKLKEFYYVGEQIELQNKGQVKHVEVTDRFSPEEEYKFLNGNKIMFLVPGIYEMGNENGKEIIAVNTNQDESKTAIANKNSIKKTLVWLKSSNIEFFDIKDLKTKQVVQWILGKDISSEILYVIALMLILETILSRLGKKLL